MITLQNCIQNEIDAMAGLVELLHEEQGVLTLAPAPAVMEQLTQLTARKNRMIAAINQYGMARRLVLQSLGFQPTESTMPEWLQDKSQKDAWAQLVRYTKKANELNRVNGLLINKHLIRNRSTLQVLIRHHQDAEAPSLYGANGQSNTRRAPGRGVAA